MNQAREAVRDYLHQTGATPVMWEEILPRDESAQRAYIDGVDRSSVFLLLVGSSYGTADSSGYSPTHKEGNRAAERKITRLLFILASVADSERDGRLNDWLRSLYNEVSGANYHTSAELVAQLDARLREMAARSERIWIKLGSLVFPGKVSSRFEPNGGGHFTVTARVSEGNVRRALLELAQAFSRRRSADRLTWADKSFPVSVESVSVETEFAAEDVVRVECGTPRNWYGESGVSTATMTYNGVGINETSRIWSDQAVFGKGYSNQSRRGGFDLIEAFAQPTTQILPQVLATYDANGWLAEGLVKLYIVEEFTVRYGGHFEHLEVGSATANSIRVDGKFIFGTRSSQNESLEIQGVVTLPN